MRAGRAAIAATVLIGSGVAIAVQAAVPATGAPPAPGVPPAAAGTAGVARSLCAPPADTIGPVIAKVTFGRPSINLHKRSWVQTIRVKASDTSGKGAPSGVAQVGAEIRGPQYFERVGLTLRSGTGTSGTWTGRFLVSKYSRPGTYSIDYLTATDAARNLQYYSGYGQVPDGPNALSLHPADNPTFTVTGTPATRPPRKPAGTLSVLSVSRSSVNTTSSPRRVHFVAQFQGAAPSRVTVELSSVKKSSRIRFVYLQARLRDHDGRWSGMVRIPRWLGNQVLQTVLFAEFGARYQPSVREYDAARLQRMHFPSRLTVVSGVDKTRPRVTSLSFSPSSPNSTDGPEKVTVTATASDTGSGVRSINVEGEIHNGANGVSDGSYPHAAAGIGYLSTQNFHVRLRKTPNGDWMGTTTIRRCVPSGTYRLRVHLADIAANYRSYSTRQLANAHITSTIDVTSEHGDTVAPYVYSAATYGADSELFLNFSEGVANVSTSTLTVYPMSPVSSRFSTPATVTGIVCSNGTNAVDCSGSAGLVTSAVLTVPAMKPGKKYDVYANLNQIVPQLTDGNRNPMDWNDAATEVIDS